MDSDLCHVAVGSRSVHALFESDYLSLCSCINRKDRNL